MKKKKFWLLATVMLLFCAMAQSQIKAKEIDYKTNPEWIKMMNDTTANYYETVIAFREYYMERALPKEPGDEERGDTFEKEVGLEQENEGGLKSGKEINREQLKPNPNEIDYAAEVRAFRGWFYETQPWLRADGKIIGPKERQAIVDKQRQELKEIEEAQGKK